ncbi:MAG TPA: porin [Gemmatimonadaceae bacterium]|nr:porin [Gemmatimonadaceae bacterium]
MLLSAFTAAGRVAGAQQQQQQRHQPPAPPADSAESAAAASAYPVAPSSVLELRHLGTSPAWSGYLAARQTRRNDSTLLAVSRARVTIMAAPRPYLALRIQGDLSNVGRVSRDSSVAAALLTDAFIQLTPSPASRPAGSWLALLDPALLVGQFKTPFSLEYGTSFSYLKTANRSQVVDRLSLRRDVGVMAQAHATPFVTVAGALTNGEGANVTRNGDNQELATGRVTLRPLPSLSLSGKWAGQGSDHLWGYDARWLWRGATVEGEALHRQGRAPGAVADPPAAASPYAAGGGYVLAAYHVLPSVEPVVKWERFREERSAAAGGVPASEVWLTTGANVGTANDRVRLQLDWVHKRIHPVDRHADELLAQLIAIF